MAQGSGGRPSERTAEERQADHAAIERLADDLLPALVAKLGASGLGELEVREGAWKVRLRMPERRPGRRGVGRSSGDAASGLTIPGAGGAASSIPAGQPASRPTADDELAEGHVRRAVATAPAVGFFRPLAGLSSGARVRTGDRVGAVDVLGVAHEILAPADGRVGATLVEPGEPVEYGQEIVEIELLPNGAHGGGHARAAADAVTVSGPRAAGAPEGGSGADAPSAEPPLPAAEAAG